MIIPSFLAITYLGQSSYLYLRSRFQFIASTTAFAGDGDWGNKVIIISLAASMAVNALVTGLIVFKILNVFLESKANVPSVERTLGSTGGTTLRHVIRNNRIWYGVVSHSTDSHRGFQSASGVSAYYLHL